jgi:hypothetical protein
MRNHAVVLITILLIIGFASVIIKIRERFDNLFTEETANMIVKIENQVCKPISKALGDNLNNMPIARNYRIVGVENDPNTCYMKMSDTIINNNQCDEFSRNLYNASFSNVVNEIRQGTITDKYVSNKVETPVCYINFKEDAPSDNVIKYASFLNSKDPDIQAAVTALNLTTQSNSRLQGAYNNLVNDLGSAQTTITNLQSFSNMNATAMTNLTSSNNSLLTDNKNKGITITNLNREIEGTKGKLTFNPQNNMIKAWNQDKCIDVSGISKDNFANVQLWDCWNGPNQRWTLDDQMRLISENSGKCLDLYYGGTQSGNKIIQYDCHDGANEKWIYDNKNRLRSQKDPSKCLDLHTYNTGQQLWIWDCHDGENQKWRLG